MAKLVAKLREFKDLLEPRIRLSNVVDAVKGVGKGREMS